MTTFADIIFFIKWHLSKAKLLLKQVIHIVMLEILLEIQEWEIYQPKGLVT